MYNPFLVYCCELAPGTVSLTGDRAQGDDSKHDSHFTIPIISYPRYREHCGSVVEGLLKTEGLRVRASQASLHCVLEQEH